jgi:hypothetical protein
MGSELRRLNIERFQRLLLSTRDGATRAQIERLIESELEKPDTAYPALPPSDATFSPGAE